MTLPTPPLAGAARPRRAVRPTPRLALLALAVVAVAAPRAVAAQGGLGTVRGVVFDSLLGRPLAGAEVWVDGSERTARADAAGRFTIDSVPAGPRRVAATHADLEALGLPTLGVGATVPAGGAATVTVATPSPATLRRSMCPSSRDQATAGVGAGDGIVFGEVRDAATDSRLAGAMAVLVWTKIDTVAGKMRVDNPQLAVRADSIGLYYACGLPRGTELEARAFAVPFASGRAVLAIGPRGIARLDLLISRDPRDTVPAAGRGGLSTSTGRAALVGIVRDTLGVARQGATVAIEGMSSSTRTDAEGRFSLSSLPAGTQTLVVRAVGYEPQLVPVGLRAGATTTADITLRRFVTLAGVEVRARATARAALLDEIAQRRATHIGELIDSVTLSRSVALRNALQRSPYLQVQSPRGGADWRVLMRRTTGTCEARIFIDGVEASWDMARDLPPEQLIAAEIFRRQIEIPIKYGGTSLTNDCGAVFLWTRTAR